MDSLYRVIRNAQEPWRPTAKETLSLVENVIDCGSADGLSINELLDSPKNRLFAKLSIAARHLQSFPSVKPTVTKEKKKADTAHAEADNENGYHHNRAVKGTINGDKSRFSQKAIAASCNRSYPQNPRNTKKLEPKSSMIGYHPTERTDVLRKHDPSETEKTWIAGGKDDESRKAAYKQRHLDNKAKFRRDATPDEKEDWVKRNKEHIGRGLKDSGPPPDRVYTGAGYNYGGATPHIHSKLAAHHDHDTAWYDEHPEEWEKDTSAWLDAHKETHGEVPDFEAVKKHAKLVHKRHQKALDDQANGVDQKADSTNRDIHDIRAREYKRRADSKENGTPYKASRAIKWARAFDASRNAGKVRKVPSDKLARKNDISDSEYEKRKGARQRNIDQDARAGFLKDPDWKPAPKGKGAGTSGDARSKWAQTHNLSKEANNIKRQIGASIGAVNTEHCESFSESSDFKKKLNPKLNNSNIRALIGDLHAALRKSVKSDRDVLNKTFPSKYGNDIISSLKFKSLN